MELELYERIAREGEVTRELPGFKVLTDILLKEGGTRVVARPEEDLEKLLNRGEWQNPLGIKMMVGRVSQCHSNCAELFSLNPGKLEIVYGWALSEDGFWRQHSWLKSVAGRRKGKIIETTVKRLAYFGFTLNSDEAEEFVFYN